MTPPLLLAIVFVLSMGYEVFLLSRMRERYALDATVVRLVLVPASMAGLGRWSGRLPAPLARGLPRAAFEASGAEAGRA